MDSTIGRQLTTAVRLFWQHKTWWWLGGLLAVGTIAGDGARLLLLPSLPWRSWAAEWVAPLSAGSLPPFDANAALTTGGGLVVAMLLLLLVGWLLAVWGEATLIVATDAPTQPLRRSARAGWHAVGRLIAIDALVFLPWFLVALAGMLLIAAVFGVSVVQSLRGQNEAAVAWLSVGFICWAPLLCLLTPLATVSFLYRLLAFREALLYGGGARAVVRRTWQRIRPQLGQLLLWIVLLQGGALLVNMLLSGAIFTGTTLLNLLPAEGWIRPFRIIGGGLLFLLSAAARALLQTFIIVAWTIAYRTFTEPGPVTRNP